MVTPRGATRIVNRDEPRSVSTDQRKATSAWTSSDPAVVVQRDHEGRGAAPAAVPLPAYALIVLAAVVGEAGGKRHRTCAMEGPAAADGAAPLACTPDLPTSSLPAGVSSRITSGPSKTAAEPRATATARSRGQMPLTLPLGDALN